ncbi:MAG: iron ABC transporter permease [Planctomycetota bacterium]
MKKVLIVIFLSFLLFATIIICLGIGPTGISYKFLSGIIDNKSESIIIYEVRLPRILGALLVGMGLAAAGCVLQAILRNPLAEPYTLGISGGAALGVTLVLIIPFLSTIPIFIGTLPVAAFIGAIISIAIIYIISSRHHFSVSSLILSGVVLSFICSSLILLVFTISKPTEIQSVLFFLMGNFATINYSLIKTISVPIIISIILLIILARDIDVLTLGDEKASHLGVSARTMRQFLFIITSLMTGCCVAAAGMVGFVGLMMPHIMRAIIGPKQQLLIISSCISGAVFLIICDTLARTAIAPAELPVGVITGVIGGLFFIGIIIHAKTI